VRKKTGQNGPLPDLARENYFTNADRGKEKLELTLKWEGWEKGRATGELSTTQAP